MALPVNKTSPIHQQICVTDAVILGGTVGAIGSFGNPLGIIGGGAMGFILGEMFCTWKPIDALFKDKTDFETGIRNFSADTGATSRALDALAAIPTVKSREEASVILRFVIDKSLQQPDSFLAAANQRGNRRMTGEELHGITTLANAATQILTKVKQA